MHVTKRISTYSGPPPPIGPPCRRSALLAALVMAVIAAPIIAVLASQQSATLPSAALSGRHDAPAAPPAGDRDRSALGADGEVADGVTVFDDAVPAVAKLNPALLDALRRAATDAAEDGVTFYVNSGWRSPEYQDQLLREAVDEYGSAAEAARWVATADTSPHVHGDAIDVGQWDATNWLSEHGAAYGLCQIYANESWHYELRPEAADDGCPAMYDDPTDDPRMQQ